MKFCVAGYDSQGKVNWVGKSMASWCFACLDRAMIFLEREWKTNEHKAMVLVDLESSTVLDYRGDKTIVDRSHV